MSAIPEPYPGFDNLPTPRTDAVDISDNWDTPDKLAALCRELEREVNLADDSYAALCKKDADLRALLRDARDAIFDNNWERIAARHLVARIDAALQSSPKVTSK